MDNSNEKVGEKLRIAIVLNTAWNIYNYRLGLIRTLLEEGHTVFAVAPSDDYVPVIEETGCTFIEIKNLSRKGMNPIQDMRYSYELFTIYKQNAIDVALQYTIKPNIYGSMAARGARIKTISTVTGLGYSFMTEGIVNAVVKRLYKTAFNSCSLIAFQNNDDKQLFENLRLCDSSKTTLVPGSGINTDYFKPLPKENPSSKLTFLFVGRLLFDKGIQELLEAAQKVKEQHADTDFWVVGGIDEGNPSAIDKQLIDDYHEQGIINYMGRSSDVRAIMRNADVVVLPSYREGLPRVLLEAVAMGKPIIATDVPGCRAVIRDGKNGWQVPAKDAAALEEALLRMYALSEEEREQMGQVGRQMALDIFDEQVIVQHYLNAIDALFEE